MSLSSPRTVALVVAAGSGSRANTEDLQSLPKQYRILAGETVLARTLRAFSSHPLIDAVKVVIRQEDAPLYERSIANLPKILPPVIGGDTRQASVHNGLQDLKDDGFDAVLIHDAARPFLSDALISRMVEAATQFGAAVPAVSIVDTLVQLDDDHRHPDSPDRDRLRASQTPQAFRFDLILDAHAQATQSGSHSFTDDGAVASHTGHKVRIVEGETGNTKITTHSDLVRAERDLTSHLLDIRMGQGFDVHAFTEGDHVVLGGLRIPFSHGLLGHSDADVVLHALTDAILGALGDGDIGAHFPPSDERWHQADSAQFLQDAADRVRARGGIIAHLDATIIGEKPKIGPHREAMRARIAEIVGIEKHRVGVKATTTEKLGFTGRNEGLAALASATIRLP